MNKSVIAILAAALALVALYYALQPPPPPPQPTTPTAPEAATPPTTQTPGTPPTTPPITTGPTTATPPGTTTPTPTQTPATPTETPRRLAGRPAFRVEIHAPKVVNVTALPTRVNYTVVVKNVGNATGTVELGGVKYTVEPGQAVAINKSLEVYAAGEYAISEAAGNATATAVIKVLYYAPALEALPAEVNVTELPTEVEVAITVVNRGNATGYIEGREVPPGGEVKIYKKMRIDHAGVYAISVANLTATVKVVYLKADIRAEPLETYFEALPGETIAVPIRLYNAGNGTATAKIGQATYTLAPGEEKRVNYTIRVDKGGIYTIEVEAPKAKYKLDVEVKVVTYRVAIEIKSPTTMGVYMENTAVTRTIEVDGPVKIRWRPVIYTNATKRAITFTVDGKAVTVKPGQPAELEERTTDAPQPPSTVDLTVDINGTRYKLTIQLAKKLPTLTVKDITKIEFRDTRPAEAKISCSRPVRVEVFVKVLEVWATVDFTRGTFRGGAKAYILGKTDTVDIEGTFGGGRGTAKISGLKKFDPLNPLLPDYVTVEFTITSTGVRIEKVKKPDGSEVSCRFPEQLLPQVLRKPTISNRIDLAAKAIVDLFAKGPSDYAKPKAVEGNKVVLEDNAGNTITVVIGQNLIVISGALEAEIYGDFALS